MRSQPYATAGADGRALTAFLDLPDAAPRSFALFVHELPPESEAATRIAQALSLRGIGVVRLALPEGAADDVAALARRMADEGRAPSVLIGHGRAGTGVLAAAADLPSVAAVATLSAPFTSLLAERISHLHRALLVLHSPRDQVVDVENATRIFVAARHPKSFVSLEPADHLLSGPADAAAAAEILAAWSARFLHTVPDLQAAPSDEHVLVQETGAGRYQVEVLAKGQSFLVDEPAAVGGLGAGPTPYQLLAAALGACTVMTLRMYANQKGWPVDRLSARVAHARDKAQQPADLFTREITIEGDLDPAQRTRLMEMADRCPVHRTLSPSSRIETRAAGGPPLPPAEPPEQHAQDMTAACAED